MILHIPIECAQDPAPMRLLLGRLCHPSSCGMLGWVMLK